MKKKRPLPNPVHTIPIEFKYCGSVYRLNVKIFENTRAINSYYKRTAVNASPSGIWAFALFDYPTRENKRSIGEMNFSLDFLHPSIIAHESNHIAFQYFDVNGQLNFKNRRREETFCDIVEDIMDPIYQYIDKHKIPFNLYPSDKEKYG